MVKYKVIKEVKLDKKDNLFIDISAQCMLKLLLNRLCKDEFPDYEADDNFDINFDFSIYGKELVQIKERNGYSNDKYINSADSFVRRL